MRAGERFTWASENRSLSGTRSKQIPDEEIDFSDIPETEPWGVEIRTPDKSPRGIFEGA